MSSTVLKQLSFHNYSSLSLQLFNLWKHGYNQALNMLRGSSCWCFIDREGSLCNNDRLNLTADYSMFYSITIRCSIVTVPTQIVSIVSIEKNLYSPTSINHAFLNFEKDPISSLMRLSYPACDSPGSHVIVDQGRRDVRKRIVHL